MDANVLPGTFPGLDCRRVRPQMNRLFRNGLGRIGWSRGMLEPLPGSRLRSFMLSSNGLPGLDPRMLSPASLPGRIGSGGGIRRRFSLRKIGEGNRFRLRTPVPAASFLLQQLFNAALRPTGPAPGGILNPVATVIIPLTPLAGLPELAMEPFRSIVQPTAQKLPGGGRRPLLQALFARLFFFDFVDLHSPPGREKGPRLRPFSAKSGCIYLLHELGGHQFVQPGIFREGIHKGHDGTAALDESPARVHVCDVAQLIIRDVQKLGQLRPVRRRLVQHNQELTVRQHGPGRMGLE